MFDMVKKHNRGALAAARDYAGCRPWRGDCSEKIAKLGAFCEDLADEYGIETPTIVRGPGYCDGTVKEGGGFYDPNTHVIVLTGGFSVMTFLRLFAHALEEERGGEDGNEYSARWANGMFSKAFPKSWAKLVRRDAPILYRDYA